MRKFKKVKRDVLDDIVCDVCGSSCRTECSEQAEGASMVEYATLEALWGYCSRRDGEQYRCDMCENCFEKISGFINSLKRPTAG